MRKQLLVFFLILVTWSLYSQNTDRIINNDTIHSIILNDQREISVYLPPSYYSSNQTYPVLYILDGDYNINYVSGILELQASISENIPEMILVGISGKGPETYRKNCKPNIEGIEDTGNAEQVANFIQKELIPFVKNNYRSSNYKILAGHSIGGLFVINTALNKSSLFNNYIAISPALWWENNAINQVAHETLVANPDLTTSAYVSLANEKGMGVDGFLNVATSSFFKNTMVIFAIAILALLLAFILFIKKGEEALSIIITVFGFGISGYLYFCHIPSNKNFKFRQFPNENHNSVGAPTYTWALKDIFKTWKGEQEYFNTTEELEAYNEKVLKEYNETFNMQKILISNTIYILQDDPGELNKFQQALIKTYPDAVANFNTQWAKRNIKKGNVDEAQNLLQETAVKYPTHFNTYNSLAKHHIQNGEMVNADSLIDKAIKLAKSQKAQRWQLNELLETKEKIK